MLSSCDMDDLTGPPTTTVASCDPQVELQLPDTIAVLKGSNNKKPQQFLGGDQDRHTLHCKKVFRYQSLYLVKYLK